jgi:trehalose-phosphatase
MRHLFDVWPQVAARLRGAGALALFLDFDGTLAPFSLRPEDVRLSQATRHVLTRLAVSPRLRVWVISGRRRYDILTRTGVPRVHYLGLQGSENGAAPRLPPETQAIVERTKRDLARRVARIPGIRFEDKGPIFTVHYRGATEPSIGQARSAVDDALSSAGVLRAIRGSKVWEILPWSIGDKGCAVRHQLSLLAGNVLPVYAGDDRTDEPAFAAIPHGITIRVGRRALSRARYYLRDPHETRDFLEKLTAALAC